jgi:hypothetical protein
VPDDGQPGGPSRRCGVGLGELSKDSHSGLKASMSALPAAGLLYGDGGVERKKSIASWVP